MREVPSSLDELPGICLLKRYLVEFNGLMRIPLYIHSANIPISLHFLSRHSWHFLRMYMSITQLPPFLHLYTAFLVMLLLKKPAAETQKGLKRLLTPSVQKNTLGLRCPRIFSWTLESSSWQVILARTVDNRAFNCAASPRKLLLLIHLSKIKTRFKDSLSKKKTLS